MSTGQEAQGRGVQQRSPLGRLARRNPMFWSQDDVRSVHSVQRAATKDSQSRPPSESRHSRRSRDARRPDVGERDVAPHGGERDRRRDHSRGSGHSRGTRSHSRSHTHTRNGHNRSILARSSSHDRSSSGHSRGRSESQSHSHARSRSHSTDARRRRRKALVTAVHEHEKQQVERSVSELSSMQVVETSSDGRGYDDERAAAVEAGEGGGGNTGEHSNAESVRTGGKEPAVQRCGCMTASTVAKTVTLLGALYFGGLLWTMHYDRSTGKLCTFHNKSMCAESLVSKGLLTISKMTAGALFPSLACCMLTKCYATRYFLHHSWLSLIVSLEPAHNLHTYFGAATLLFSCVHAAAHVARILYDGHSFEMVDLNVDRSGIVSMVLLLPIVVPMLFGRLKSWLSFEFRKMLHMLFIPLGIAICFHTPTLRVVGAILLTWYTVDRLYFTTRMTFFIERPVYKPVGRGTFIRFDLPTGYQFKVGAYVQVNCPAISAYDWHPFSLFPVPGSKPRAGFHVEAVGDWTQELFRLCLENPHMPLWITAAQPSVLEKSIYFDNVLLVCTGAGITPAVSLTEMFAKKKNVHLLWLSREASMIAMFEKQLRQVKSTVHLTGNPSPKTRMRIVDLLAPSRGEVVVAAPRAPTRPSSRSSSHSDLTALEAGAGTAPSAGELLGELREDGEEGGHLTDTVSGGSRSVLGGYSTLTGLERQGSMSSSSRRWSSSTLRFGGGARAAVAVENARFRGSPVGDHKRPRGLHPVSVHFGRPDVGRFIAETVHGTVARPEWVIDQCQRAAVPVNVNGKSAPRTRQVFARQAIERLNTNQRISKRHLMTADLSVVVPKSLKGPSISGAEASAGGDGDTGGDGEVLSSKEAIPTPTDPSTWLVLYCGANLTVEKAVASTCDKLKIAWRKEYFSSW